MGKETYGEFLQREIKARGLTGPEFARKCGFGVSTIYRITHDKNAPKPTTRAAITKALAAIPYQSEPFGVYLRKEIQARGITINQFAKRSGFNRTTISQTIRLISRPRYFTRRVLIDTLRCFPRERLLIDISPTPDQLATAQVYNACDS